MENLEKVHNFIPIPEKISLVYKEQKLRIFPIRSSSNNKKATEITQESVQDGKMISMEAKAAVPSAEEKKELDDTKKILGEMMSGDDEDLF